VVREDRLYALYVLAFAAGLRKGELLGLRWADVDLAAGELTVRQTVQRVDGALRFHDMRHTCVTLLLSLGVPRTW
jgi:integrase